MLPELPPLGEDEMLINGDGPYYLVGEQEDGCIVLHPMSKERAKMYIQQYPDLYPKMGITQETIFIDEDSDEVDDMYITFF